MEKQIKINLNIEHKEVIKMYRIAVCDDQNELLALISNHLRAYRETHALHIEVTAFQDSTLLLEAVEGGKSCDAYILDIVMPSCSGMELIKSIKEKTLYAPIILLTAYEQYAVEACGMNLCGYVLKDRITDDLEPALDRLFLQLARLDKEKTYVISNQRKYLKLLQQDIVCIYKNQRNAVFSMANEAEEQERISLKDVYKKLNNPDMYLLDRCTILNLRRIEKIGSDGIFMENGQRIHSSAPRIAALKEYLSRYWSTRL